MARLYTAGLHKPSALQYLISEGLLPHDSEPSDYRWSQQISLDEHDYPVREEILILDHCVVWSRSQSVERVFNLDIEDEVILHAFTTSFPTSSVTSESTKNLQTQSRPSDTKEAALVVVLKTQIHIFCLSGGIHVIPLTFVTARALPFSEGCILQPQSSRTSDRFLKDSNSHVGPIQDIPPSDTVLNLQGSAADAVASPARKLPTYCITDLLSDIGLVAMSSSRKVQSDTNSSLPAEEEILYMSTDSHTAGIRRDGLSGICIAVTLNRHTSNFTIWSVLRHLPSSVPMDRLSDSSKYRKRQSASVHDRPRAPSGRVPPDASRESLGGLIQSFVDNPTNAQEARLSNIENLAAELHDEFEPGGVQTRSSRRISSMLARSELAPSTERSAFNDNLRGVASRKSLSKSIRREGSFGSITDRHSFGGRKSFAGAASVTSNATSFFNPTDRMSFGELMGPGAIDGPELASSSAGLQKDLGFHKLKTFSCHEMTVLTPSAISRVLLIAHPPSFDSENAPTSQISVCVQECEPQVMTVVTISVKKSSYRGQQYTSTREKPELKAVQVQKGANIADTCLVSDRMCDRLVVLTKTSQGDGVLHLEAPWSPSFRLELPPRYLVHPSNTSNRRSTESRAYVGGVHRTIDGSDVKPSQFLTSFNLNTIILCDTSGRQHDLRLQMASKTSLGLDVTRICRFVLPAQHQDSLLIAYWEIRRWLDTQEVQGNLENIAIAITLFSMAVPFISTFQERPLAPNRKKKTVSLRSSSGGFIDATDWSFMQIDEAFGKSPAWTQSGAWAWLGTSLHPVVLPKSPSKHSRSASLDQSDSYANKVFLSQCIDLTRDFLQSPAGENMSGTEGYLPSAINQDRNTRRTALASIVIALFLLLQEYKLRLCTDESINNDRIILTILVAQLSLWLKWPSWRDVMSTQYENEGFPKDRLQLYQSEIDNLDVPPEPFKPIPVFEYIHASMKSTPPKYHMLVDLLRTEELANNDPLSIESAKLLPRLFAIVGLLNGKCGRMGPSIASAMPDIISAACEHSLQSQAPFMDEMGGIPSTRNSVSLLDTAVDGRANAQHAHRKPSHVAVRDTRVLGNQALDAETLSRWDASSEVDRHTVTKLIFHQDRRFQDASKLVNQTRAPEIEFEIQPNWTEANALEAQKQLTQYATRRTFAVATGRGMMHFNSRTPLLTEMIPVPKFSLQCIMRSRSDAESGQPMTFSADRTHFTEEKVYWAFFHNGASAGLMISKEADFIDTSWILYNKPPELTNRHAGLLLALGLNGHLKSLAKWVAFKYLTPKHTMTSVGLLLGLAASYRGTADTLITRLLSVHVTCLLPPGAAELNLSPLTQMTGMMGIGLVYCNTQHRRMSEVMLSEIECQDIEDQSGDEPILRDEGYRLISGMSLGLINLGHGTRLHSLHDMRLVERLLAIAVGTKNVNLVHVLDRATAGAVLALAFVFMKTNDVSVARKVDIPDTVHQFDYVRPDIFLLRTLARHVIMWNKIVPTARFVQESLPSQFRHRADLSSVKRLVTNDLPFFHVIAGICFAISLRCAGSQRPDARDLLIGYLDHFLRLSRLPAHSYDARVTLDGIRNCLDILALSCATIMAGSGDVVVFRRLRALHGRTDKDTPYGSHLAAHMAIGALFLSGGTATFGTSNIAVASLVIAFYPLFPGEVLDNRGHLQALRHLWVIAVEHRCILVRDSEDGQVVGGIEALLVLKDDTEITLRTPGLLPDLDTVTSISVTAQDYWPIVIYLDHPESQDSAANLQRKYSPGTIRDRFKSSSTGIHITLHRRAIYEKPKVDPFDSELEALDINHHVPFGPHVTTRNSTDTKSSLDWVFTLPTFNILDHAERALVLDASSAPQIGGDHQFANMLLATTPIDTRLELEIGTLGSENAKIPGAMRKDIKSNKLWLTRTLLSWAERVEEEEENRRLNGHTSSDDEKMHRTGLRRDVVERLRWRVWRMSSGEQDEDVQHDFERGKVLPLNS